VANINQERTQNTSANSFAGSSNFNSELRQFANQTGSTTPGVASYRIFSTVQTLTGGMARALRPGDKHLLGMYDN
jgi:hypothetical protein